MNKRSAHIRKHKISKIFLWRKIFIAFILLILVAFGINQYQSSRFLTKNQRLNLAVNSNPVMLMSFSDNPQDKQTVLVLPRNVYLPVTYGYGNYRIESLWQLAVLEKNPLIFADTLADTFGLPVHFYIHKPGLPALTDTNNNTDILDFIKKYFSLTSWLSSVNKTNLNFIDKLIISHKIFVLRSSDMLIYKLEDVPYLIDNITLPDTSIAKELNQEALDTFMEQKFENEQIRLEGLTVEIQNTTSVSKIGQKFSRFLVNSGAKVIAVTSSNEYITGCSVVANKSNTGKSLVKFLVADFSCRITENKDEKSIDILVKLGESFGKRWNF